jgi:Lon protease-like protein
MAPGRPTRIPLFPIDVVLFPGMLLPLHIFEPRYRALTRYCLENRREFGVVLDRRKEIAGIGCTAEIVKVVEAHPDGRMDIITQGRARFAILELIEETTYPEARVEYHEDVSDPSLPSDDPELREMFARCHTLVYGRSVEPPEVPEGAFLSYQIVAELPLDLELKQALLGLCSETERRRLLHKILPRWAHHVEMAQIGRAKAAGNGHGRIPES